MLAVLKAGGADVPLDPPARIQAIVSEADVKIALTSATLEDGIKPLNSIVRCGQRAHSLLSR